MNRSYVVGVGVLLTAISVQAQDKDWKKSLEQSLRDAYVLTAQGRMDRNQISKAGTVYVVQQDGITAERVTLSGVYRTFVKDGVLRQAGGGAKLVNILNGEKREASRILKKGDEVYVVGIEVEGDTKLVFNLLTVDVGSTVVRGSTSQTRYKAGLQFDFDKGFLATSTPESLKAIVDPFLRSHGEHTAPKTIELGQSIEQVEQILGKPVSVAKLGTKTIYTYKDMKVIFMNGKVSDVQ